MGIVQQITDLEKRAEMLDCLCGTMIATLKLNFDRGHLVCPVDGKNALLGEWITAWKAQYADAMLNHDHAPESLFGQCGPVIVKEVGE
jgi:hypothetical protein